MDLAQSSREAAVISYGDSEDAWRGVGRFIETSLLDIKAKRILEVGAGANPLFPESFLDAHGLTYTAFDISAAELQKAPACYHKLLGDICTYQPKNGEAFDFIFSRMLAEHVTDGAAFHKNVFKLLAPGGRAFHFFPTLWAPPFLINRWVPEQLATSILRVMQPTRDLAGHQAKFPAYYDWCRGPTSGQLARLQQIGYQVDKYVGFFGHRGYYLKFGPLLKGHDALSRWLLRNPMPRMTSFAFLLLSKPR